MKVERGDIFLTNLNPVIGSEQGKVRPALIIQNDFGNKHSPITIIAPITSKLYTRDYPTNVKISAKESSLKRDGTVVLNQVRAIDKSRLLKRIGRLDELLMLQVNMAIEVSLGLRIN